MTISSRLFTTRLLPVVFVSFVKPTTMQKPIQRARMKTVLEANPNPQIARGEDFAASAEKIGLTYEAVLQRIINLGLRWQPESVA